MKVKYIIYLFILSFFFASTANASSLELNNSTLTLDGTHTYDYINLTNSSIIYVSAYNGTGTTGALILNVTEINVDSTSSIVGYARGYRGGAGGESGDPYPNCGGYGGIGGEIINSGGGSNGSRGGGGSYPTGGGGAGGGGYGASGNNGGAGGGGGGGGGGGSGGNTKGTIYGDDISIGSGAGGGGGGSGGSGCGSQYNSGASGKPGGAMIIINATNVNIYGVINFSGGTGGKGGDNTVCGAGGGGGGASGGGIFLKGENINLTGANINASGGAGGAGGAGGFAGAWNGQPGGAGGGGRIKIFYNGIYINTGANISAGSGTVTIQAIPGKPTSLTASISNFWVNYSWISGLSTDSFNVSYNNTWTNGTTVTSINRSVGAHGWGNITVYGYNATNNTLGDPASSNTQVPNNAIVISNVSSSYTVNASETLTINAKYSDLDGDTGTFDRNFTNGSLNTSTGVFTWTPTFNDAGTHYFQINVSDGWGSVSAANFSVTIPYISALTMAYNSTKTLVWTWTDPINSSDYNCTEIYFSGNYYSCKNGTGSYSATDLSASTSYTLSLRVRNVSSATFSWVNLSSQTRASTSPPSIDSSQSVLWFSAALGQNVAISVAYNGTAPVRHHNITIYDSSGVAVRNNLNLSYSYNYSTINRTLSSSWTGTANNGYIVGNGYYYVNVTVTDYDDNTATFQNTTAVGLDNLIPKSVMSYNKAHLYTSLAAYSNYSSPDALYIYANTYVGDFYYYGDESPINANPITGESNLANTVIIKSGFISTPAGTSTFSLTKDSDGKAWLWVDNNLVYNSNSGQTSTDLTLSSGLHNFSLLYAKGTTNSEITVSPKINGSSFTFVAPTVGTDMYLHAFDYNQSGVNAIKYSLNYGAYQVYNGTPIDISEADVITICSNDTVNNNEACWETTPTFTTPTYLVNSSPTIPSDASSPDFPQYLSELVPPDYNPETTVGTLSGGLGGGGGGGSCGNPGGAGTGGIVGSPASYAYNYFNRSIYTPSASIAKVTTAQSNWNTNLAAVMRPATYALGGSGTNYPYSISSCGSCAPYNNYDMLGSEFRTYRIDLYKYDYSTWYTYAQALYAPDVTIELTGSYTLGDNITFSITFAPWSSSDSVTNELTNVKVLWYNPNNDFTGTVANVSTLYNIGTINRNGGTWSFYYDTDIYNDLVGSYKIYVWAPTVGGVIKSATALVSLGDLTSNDYTEIKLFQYFRRLYCTGWCYIGQGETSQTLSEISATYPSATSVGWYNYTTKKYQTYKPGYSANSGIAVPKKYGYYLYFSTQTNITVLSPSTTTIQLTTGWNLVSNFNSQRRTLSTLSSSVPYAFQISYYDKYNRTWVTTSSKQVPSMESFMVYISQNTTWEN